LPQQKAERRVESKVTCEKNYLFTTLDTPLIPIQPATAALQLQTALIEMIKRDERNAREMRELRNDNIEQWAPFPAGYSSHRKKGIWIAAIYIYGPFTGCSGSSLGLGGVPSKWRLSVEHGR
jgi:hypothetical protein